MRWRGGAVRGWGLHSLALASAIGWLQPSPVLAANGARPRTPPVFHEETCLSIVDRSADPVFVLSVSMPVEEPSIGPDELEDSRRFQFFALCEDAHLLASGMPNWIALDDAQRALEHDPPIIEQLPPEQDVLQTHPLWTDCAHPILGTRLPITCEALEGGVAFDTTGLPVGNYVIRGYTFEPALNLWRGRRGVVQVTDDGQPRPVVSLMTPATESLTVVPEQGFPIRGCMAGPAGTTVTLSWASLIDLDVDEPEDWHAFAQLERQSEDQSDGASQTFEVLFDPPSDALYQPLVIRAQVFGSDGSVWTSHAPGTLAVFPDGQSDDAQPAVGPDVCGFYPDDTAGSGTGSDSGASPSTGVSEAGTDGSGSGTDTDGAMPQGDTSGSGCACAAQGRRASLGRRVSLGWIGALAVLAFAAVRRRRASVRSSAR